MLIHQPPEQNEKLWLMAFKVANRCFPMQKQTPQATVIWCRSPSIIEGVWESTFHLGLKPGFIHLHDIWELPNPDPRVKLIWIDAWLMTSHLWNKWQRQNLSSISVLIKGKVHTCSVVQESNRLCGWTELSHYLRNHIWNWKPRTRYKYGNVPFIILGQKLTRN